MQVTSAAPPTGRRSGADACPGAVRVHRAADGGLARVRLPGGLLTPDQLDVLRRAAVEMSDGYLELTSRANVQLRALKPGAETELAARLHAAGLLPSERHETVRNIVCSPLALQSTRALVADLDRRLCADDALSGLPGRFLFVLDDGSGDVAGLGGDVTVVGESAVLLGGVAAEVPGAPVDVLLAAAHAFLAERAAQRSAAWRLAELADGPARVAARLGGQVTGPVAVPPVPAPVGVLDGAVGAVVPLGRLSAEQATVLADTAPADAIIVTPWRGVVVPGLADPSVLAAAGLVTDPASPWVGVTTCAGRPGCATSLADVRADATAAIGDRRSGDPAQHWIGCPRGCGRPAGRHVEYLATGDGYEVTERDD